MSTQVPGDRADEEAKKWMTFVREDLRVAELAFDDSLWNQVCFHSHQATEKSLKALLALDGVTPPRTHRLMDLATSLEREHPSVGRLTDDLLSLESYYIPTRYPDALPGSLPEGSPGGEDARDALTTARKVSDLVWRKVEENG